MLSMAKKKKQDQDKDRHGSGFMIRLPEIYRTQLRKLREQMRRPMTSEIQIALEEHLAKFNLWPPSEKADEQ
jgi:hypothetical protein